MRASRLSPMLDCQVLALAPGLVLLVLALVLVLALALVLVLFGSHHAMPALGARCPARVARCTNRQALSVH